MNPFRVGWIHDCFGGWSQGDWLWEIGLSGSGDPGDLWGEPFNVFFFCVQSFFSDKNWEITVVDSIQLNPFVEFFLNLFPNEITPRSQNVTP